LNPLETTRLRCRSELSILYSPCGDVANRGCQEREFPGIGSLAPWRLAGRAHARASRATVIGQDGDSTPVCPLGEPTRSRHATGVRGGCSRRVQWDVRHDACPGMSPGSAFRRGQPLFLVFGLPARRRGQPLFLVFGLPARGLPGVRDTIANFAGSTIRLRRRMHARAENVRRKILDEHGVVEWAADLIRDAEK
jgi:hypothetical protein